MRRLFSLPRTSVRRVGQDFDLPMKPRRRIAADAHRLDRSALRNLLHEVAAEAAQSLPE
jgi:hypothetical protein